MLQAARGYTIVEVMIVLAISTALFIAAISLFNGQQGETGFNQSMQDLNSKVLNYANEVKAGKIPDTQGWNCIIDTYDDAAFTPPGSNVGSPDCIYMGRLFQLIPGSKDIYVYKVFGNRTDPKTGQINTDFIAAGPEPMQDTNEVYIQVDDYHLLYGAQIVSSKISGFSGSYGFIGFYNGIGGGGSPSGGFFARAYPFSSSSSYEGKSDNPFEGCIQAGPPCDGSNTKVVDTWKLCLADSQGQRQTEFDVKAAPAGITTQLNFSGCS